MQFLNAICNAVGDALLAGFPLHSPWPGMIAAALALTVALSLIFKACSNGDAIRRTRGRLVARVLELVLYRHDMAVSLTACGRILWENCRYLAELSKPLAAAAVPCGLMLIQLACWFDARPLRVGETTLVEVRLKGEVPVTSRTAVLAVPDIVAAQTAPLRIPALNEVDWRIEARRDGSGWIDIQIGDFTARKQIVVGDRLLKLSARRVGAGWWNQLLHPVESPLDSTGPIESISVRYPPRKLLLGETEIHWLLALFLLTVVFGLLLMRPLKVQWF
jgi:hypothetical protein